MMVSFFLPSISQVKGLEDFLANQGQPAHVIWTSSATALKQPFDIDDIQHVEGYSIGRAAVRKLRVPSLFWFHFQKRSVRIIQVCN